MAIARRRTGDWVFILPSDKGKKDATEWVLRDHDKAAQRLAESVPDLAFAGDSSFTWEYCKVAIKGVKNFNDADGNPVKFEADEDGRATDAFIDAIQMEDRAVISGAWIEAGRLTKADRKN